MSADNICRLLKTSPYTSSHDAELRREVTNSRSKITVQSLQFNPLHLSVLANNADATSSLLAMGVNPDQPCIFGRTPEDYAVLTNSFGILDLFEDHRNRKLRKKASTVDSLSRENNTLKRRRDEQEDEIEDLKSARRRLAQENTNINKELTQVKRRYELLRDTMRK